MRKSRKKGVVLIAVLWLVMLLTVICASVERSSRLNTKLNAAGNDALRCKWAARAGIETAVAVLNDDLRASDSLSDLWSDNEYDFTEIQMENCMFNVEVFDESGKLNINCVTKDQLMMLTDMTEEIADSIIDWRDANDLPNANGAEVGYYLNLQFPYIIPNGPFKTVRELLLVKGVTEELLFGEDTNFNGLLDYNEKDGAKNPPNDNSDNILDKGWIEYLTCYSLDTNTDADGNAKININTADQSTLVNSLGLSQANANWIIQNRPTSGFTSIVDLISSQTSGQTGSQAGGQGQGQSQTGGQATGQSTALDMSTFTTIADKITVDTNDTYSGKVNINTAPREVLMALFSNTANAQILADSIISYRDGLPEGMTSIAEVLNVPSMNTDTFRTLSRYITVRANVFSIRSFAYTTYDGLNRSVLRTEAVVDRSSLPIKVLYWYQDRTN